MPSENCPAKICIVFTTQKQNKLTEYWFAPFTLYRKKWNEIGGHDTIFRRSREDSDILYRMCLKGMKFKQDWNAIVYHFTCTSSRGKEWWKEQNQEKNNIILRNMKENKNNDGMNNTCNGKGFVYKILTNIFGTKNLSR